MFATMTKFKPHRLFKILACGLLVQALVFININLFCACYNKPEPNKVVTVSEKSRPITATEILTQFLTKKLSAPAAKEIFLQNGCNQKETLANSCNGTCLQMEIPKEIHQRVAQIVDPKHLQMTPKEHQVLKDLSTQVSGQHHVMILTAASSSYYRQSQALLKNLHEVVLPGLQNYTLVYYNLGLSAKERSQVVKHCKCQVVDFPFRKFPVFFTNLKCYTWKPAIIKAHINQADVLVWLDASIRFEKDAFMTLVKRTQERGLQLAGPDGIDAAFHTMPSMYHFFGDEPCAYLGMGEIYATLGFFSREFLVERLFLEPWMACALNRSCMCPTPYPPLSAHASHAMIRNWRMGRGPVVYGLVHRFDQSAISLLVQKLYRHRFRDALFGVDGYLTIRRGEGEDYFPSSS